MLGRVFELFVQERQNLDRARGGLGLGLAIVRNLVALHGGRVEVSSPGPRRGSTFTVRLPCAPDRAAATGAAQPAPGPDAGPAHALSVLVVDDNVDAATLLGIPELARLPDPGRARRRGGAPARRRLRARRRAVDIGLPAMDGYELARRLRALPAWRQRKRSR